MIAGFERYYQIARCFRDEDTRADRQPEFTQLDLEMAFVDEDDVIEVMEAVMGAVFDREGFPAPPPPWPRMTFAEAVSRYGIDRPDTRFGLELHDLGSVLHETEFKVFADVLGGGGVIRGINAGKRELPRSELDELTELAKQHGAKGLVWAFVQDGEEGWRSPIAKFLSPVEISGVNEELEASSGDLLLIVADELTTAGQALSALRMEIGRRFALIDPSRHEILWVVEFPAFFWNAELQRWDSAHHPFTAPTGDLNDPGHLSSRAYDLVLDGSEIGGGSIRIHRREIQERVFELLAIGPDEAQARFGFLLDALRYGAPPHGGIAMGIDRIVALIAGRQSIREVIAFPKAASGADPLTGAPAPVDPVQLRELGLRRL
jgi:aspartyl-tRNA synthetase